MEVIAIEDQIKQVFLNLIQNAEESITEGGGTLTIKTRVVGSSAEIRVQDTGTGILPENLELIFEPFYTTKGAVKGTGLGLSVSYGIIKAAGGDIQVQSEPGKGSVFITTLPGGL